MEHGAIYTTDVITRLEMGWGKGWLSPGGRSDVAELIAGVGLAQKSVLDIGVGTGGPAAFLLAAAPLQAAPMMLRQGRG